LGEHVNIKYYKKKWDPIFTYSMSSLWGYVLEICLEVGGIAAPWSTVFTGFGLYYVRHSIMVYNILFEDFVR
jgi:hypothetical protein